MVSDAAMASLLIWKPLRFAGLALPLSAGMTVPSG